MKIMGQINDSKKKLKLVETILQLKQLFTCNKLQLFLASLIFPAFFSNVAVLFSVNF